MNIQERIEALETEFAEKIKALKAEMQQRDGFPQNGDNYWYVDGDAEVVEMEWDDCDYEQGRLSIGNIFKTEEQAEFAVEKLKVEAELRKHRSPFGLYSLNHYIFLNTDDDCLGVDCLAFCQTQGTIYFESKEKAQQAIQSVGEERIKKYIFGVED